MKSILGCVICLFLSVEAEAQWSQKTVPQFYNGTGYESPRVEETTHAVDVIEHWYGQIIAGNHYFLDGVFPNTGSGVTKSFGVVAPSGSKRVHMTFSIAGSAETRFYMYEAESGSTVFATSGATVTPRNSNRNFPDNSSLAVYPNVVHVQTGVSTMLFDKIFGTTGSNPANPGAPGGGGRGSKILFGAGKKYLVLFVSGGADNDMNYTAEWMEQ